jgi:serine/threonine protein kinase
MVVYPLGRPIARFHTVEGFLRGFRDAISGYRSLHLDGKILHRDISPNNIMLAEDKKEGEPWGFLIDLDLSMELAVGPARPGEIIGTKAFMAIDVLKCIPRTYR